MLVGPLILTLATAGMATPLRGQPLVRLHCRLGQAPWRPCQMLLNPDGMGWRLHIDQMQFQFRHDGQGTVSMQHAAGRWQVVEARWQTDASLCWDGVCAQGAIPLD